MGGSVRAIAVAALLAPSLLCAQPSITFDGERYDKQFENRRGGDSVVEYVRPAEKLENWTKLVAVRHFSKLTDAKEAAANLARVVQQHNPQARSQVIAKDDGSEALVDFLTWQSGDDRLEFNVHRYRKIAGVPGLVAYQFAWRFRSAELANPGETVRADRKRYVDALIAADFGPAPRK
jgi:hypothetical protein